MTQAGPICVLALGLVPVLLLGEIDLSAGVAGSTGAMATACSSSTTARAGSWRPWPQSPSAR